MARWKARVELLLSVIELLFLYLAVEALPGKMCQNSLPSGGGRSLGAKISGRSGRPPPNILIPLERQLIALQLCRWQFLYNETLQHFSSFIVEIVQKTTNLGIYPHFEEVRGGVEPWLMARWKARVEFLLSVSELLFLSLAVEVLQGKICQNSLSSRGCRSFGAKISGGRGRPWGIFCGFYKTRHILLSYSANCTVLRAAVLTQYRRVTDGRTDRRTELP